jgi:TRAP-type C4-dicarboxylate transport system permease small subunit
MQKVLETIDRISTVMAVIAFLPLCLILLVNIVLRQFGVGISWYMEAVQYLNIWVVLIATVGTCATNDHLRIDAIEVKLKGTAKRILRLLVAVLTIVFLIVLGYSLLLLASRSRQFISTMPSLRMAYVFWPLPILCFFSAISCLLHAIWDFARSIKEEKNQLLTSESKT